MTRPPSPLSNAARPARRSLTALAAETTNSTIVEEQPLTSSLQPAAIVRASLRSAKYPSATVYLPRRAIRLIKEIGLEENRRISDLLAEAVDEYLTKRGHPSLKQLSQ